MSNPKKTKPTAKTKGKIHKVKSAEPVVKSRGRPSVDLKLPNTKFCVTSLFEDCQKKSNPKERLTKVAIGLKLKKWEKEEKIVLAEKKLSPSGRGQPIRYYVKSELAKKFTINTDYAKAVKVKKGQKVTDEKVSIEVKETIKPQSNGKNGNSKPPESAPKPRGRKHKESEEDFSKLDSSIDADPVFSDGDIADILGVN